MLMNEATSVSKFPSHKLLTLKPELKHHLSLIFPKVNAV